MLKTISSGNINFDQEKLIKLNETLEKKITAEDLLFLDWFLYCKSRGIFPVTRYENTDYYYFGYDEVKSGLPFLRITRKAYDKQIIRLIDSELLFSLFDRKTERLYFCEGNVLIDVIHSCQCSIILRGEIK